MGKRGLQVRDSDFREIEFLFRGLSGESIGPSWFRPAPFDLDRFRPGPSGSLSPRHPEGFIPPACLSSGCSSPRSRILSSTASTCACECTSPGVRSPTALDRSGRPLIPEDSSLRHVPSSGFLTRLTAFATHNPTGLISSPLRSWGYLGPSRSRKPFSRRRAMLHPSLLSKAYLQSRDEQRVACSPPLRVADAPGQGGRTVLRTFKYEQPSGGRCGVSITEESVYPEGATQGHQPS